MNPEGILDTVEESMLSENFRVFLKRVRFRKEGRLQIERLVKNGTGLKIGRENSNCFSTTKKSFCTVIAGSVSEKL